MMNCQTDILKDFDSRAKAMGLNCPYANAEGINDLVSCAQTLGHYCLQYIGAYNVSNSALCDLGSGHARV